MKKILLPLVLFIVLFSCTKESEIQIMNNYNAEKTKISDSLEYTILGNHAYIRMKEMSPIAYFPEYILPAVNQFEEVNQVKVISFTPEITYMMPSTIEGIWITFEKCR